MTRHIPQVLPADDSPASGERSSWRRKSAEVAVREAEAAEQRDKEYRVLAGRISAADDVLGDAISDGIRARWDFGKALLAERGTRKQLPNGRMEEICKLVGNGEREVQRWVQFAEQYPTEDAVRLAGRQDATPLSQIPSPRCLANLAVAIPREPG